jgi:RsiW-degrading membrane proteinase PrsW (M82 family)
MIFLTTFLIPFAGKIAIAFLGGLIPVLIWLWIFEREDKHPEPYKLILWAFIGGMLGVIAVVPFEEVVAYFLPPTSILPVFSISFSYFAVLIASSSFWCFLLWAAIEESVKFIAAHITVLQRADNDEPVDSMMYMIMTALGFAAVENALFIARPLLEGDFAGALAVGNIRFLEATLIHVVCSSILGFALSLSFYKSKARRRIYWAIGLAAAIILHTFFNLSIILSTGSTAFTLYAVWFGLIIILILFHKVKGITKKSRTS